MDAIQQAATDLMIAIAGEGRKYGIYLFLATQRPDKLHPNVISQCDNLMLMRMNSQADIERLAEIFSFVPKGLLAEAAAFRQGEALLAGKTVPSPMTVRIGSRLSAEGGMDIPTTWATARE
jgi:DNA helicase HerA-like ATPase